MTTTHATQTEPFKKPMMRNDLAQIDKLELMKLLSSIDVLHTILRRNAYRLDRKSVEVFSLTHTALKIIQHEVDYWFVFQRKTNYQNQLEIWDNEGGRIENVS